MLSKIKKQFNYSKPNRRRQTAIKQCLITRTKFNIISLAITLVLLPRIKNSGKSAKTQVKLNQSIHLILFVLRQMPTPRWYVQPCWSRNVAIVTKQDIHTNIVQWLFKKRKNINAVNKSKCLRKNIRKNSRKNS